MIWTKKINKIVRIFRNIICGCLIIVIVWILINNFMTAYEKYKYKEPGIMVTVDNKQMHVYKQGKGENTIVLMSGLGTAAPVMDFEPIINELSKDNKVVVVEPFGYGWSDLTDKERTVENMIEELRIALSEANIDGPYILMPHSISGIYATYYANTYPNEVKAIIGIDSTLPRVCEYFDESIPSMPSFMSLLAPTGIARLALLIMPDEFMPIDNTNIYSDENIKITKAISAWKGYNINIVNEGNERKRNIEATIEMEFNQSLPVLIFTKEHSTRRSDGKDSRSFYETYLKDLVNQQIIVLDGHHYLHWDYYKEICKYTNEFLDKISDH